MKAFRRLCRVTALRTLRDPVTVVFSFAFAPVFIIGSRNGSLLSETD